MPDASIVAAQQRLWRDLRIAAEPGAAAALAALLSGAYRPEQGERVGVLAGGGSADLATLTWRAYWSGMVMPVLEASSRLPMLLTTASRAPSWPVCPSR